MVTSHNIVSMDPKILNPFLWRTLPKDLLLLVLARLPLLDIMRLRCLSWEWKKDMAIVNSEINQACQEANPTMVAILSHFSTNAFFVTIYDIKKSRWQYAYYLHLRMLWNDDSKRGPYTWTVVDVSDDGLVCFISLWKPTEQNPLCIVVVNLLTQVQHELPPLHYQYYTLPTMVKIKVDSHKKCYEVVVISNKRSSLIIEIYDSSTRQWTIATPPCGYIFGHVYNWTIVHGWYHKLTKTLGSYDFVKGKLELYSHFSRENMIASVLKKDCMFVLQEQMQTDSSHCETMHRNFSIIEYHIENQTKDWVQGKSYECPFSEELLVQEFSTMCLYACDGFVMIIFNCSQSQYFWLLDLSTSEWSKPPKTSMGLHTKRPVLCKAIWNIIP